eukprot:1147943-Pelagomonas_calceolata.AAC.6
MTTRIPWRNWKKLSLWVWDGTNTLLTSFLKRLQGKPNVVSNLDTSNLASPYHFCHLPSSSQKYTFRNLALACFSSDALLLTLLVAKCACAADPTFSALVMTESGRRFWTKDCAEGGRPHSRWD